MLANVTRLDPPKSTGRPRANACGMLRQMMLVLESGMSWRQLQRCAAESSADYRTVHRNFTAWSRLGVFQNAYSSLLKLYSRKTRRGEYHCIDTTYVKNIYGKDCVGRNPTDRGRRATKLSAIVNDEGIPLSLVPFSGNTSDYKTVDGTLQRLNVTPMSPCPMYADKGYDSSYVRSAFRKCGYIDRVSKRRFRVHKTINRKRGIVERFFSWLDKNRRLIVRYDASVAHYMAWTWLASCKLIANRIRTPHQFFDRPSERLGTQTLMLA